jgi:sec-independent protein translocase protein TatB
MFDLSFGELVVVAVLALLVLGPQRLPKAARFAGLWVRKARAQWYSVKSEFERELAADEMKRSVGNPVQDLRDDVEGLGRGLGDSVRDLESEARADADAATAILPPEPGAATDDAPGTPRDDEATSPIPDAADDETPPAGKRAEPPAP